MMNIVIIVIMMAMIVKVVIYLLFQGVREHIDDVRDRENEIGGDYDIGSDSDEGFDVNNSTHTTKVILSQKSQVQNKI